MSHKYSLFLGFTCIKMFINQICSFVTEKLLILTHVLLILNLQIGQKLYKKMKESKSFFSQLLRRNWKKWYQVSLLWELSPLANKSSKMVSLGHHTVPEPFLKFFFSLATGVQSEVPKIFLNIYHHLTKIYFSVSPCTKEEILKT